MKRVCTALLCAALCALFLFSCSEKAPPESETVRVVSINDTACLTAGELIVNCSVSLRLVGGGDDAAGAYTGKLYVSYATDLGALQLPAELVRRYAYQPVGFGHSAEFDADIVPFDDAEYVEFLVTESGFDTLPSAQLTRPTAQAMCLWADLPFTDTSFSVFGGLPLSRAVAFFSETNFDAFTDADLPDALALLLRETGNGPLPCALLLHGDGTATFTIFGPAGHETDLTFTGTVEQTEKASAEAEAFSC